VRRSEYISVAYFVVLVSFGVAANLCNVGLGQPLILMAVLSMMILHVNLFPFSWVRRNLAFGPQGLYATSGAFSTIVGFMWFLNK
tara:strand:- start:431 stop:685 length:255 start_codon:yes stop_codon:yes gene_type:complete